MKVIYLFVFILSASTSFAQKQFSTKFEANYLSHRYVTVKVDPGENWQGYNLTTNGYEFTASAGTASARRFVGLGAAYQRFDKYNGASVFVDYDRRFSKRSISPLLNIRIGYNHLWNQYEGGRGSFLSDFKVGVDFRFNDKQSIFLKSGIMLFQQSNVVPIKMGVRF
jgi:hypothetical protein